MTFFQLAAFAGFTYRHDIIKQVAIQTWSADDYVDADGDLKPRMRRGMEKRMTSLLDVLKYTAQVLPEIRNSATDDVSKDTNTAHDSYELNFNQLSTYPIYAIPSYFTPETHQLCLKSGSIPSLTLKAFISEFSIPKLFMYNS